MNNDEIIKLYQSGYSKTIVAKILQTTEGKVRWALHRANIHRGTSEAARQKFERHISEQELRIMYIEQKMSGREIAKKLGLSISRVHKWLVRFNIPRRSPSQSSTLRDYRFCKRGAEHPSWKGGRFKHSSGHILIYAPEHQRHNSRGYVSEHIIIWEQAHNQQVPEGWEIHHFNGIKDDNRPENLVALSSHKHKLVIRELKRHIRQLENELKALKKQRNLL